MAFLRKLCFVDFILGCVFTLLSIPIGLDLSLLALPVAAGTTFLLYFFGYRKTLKPVSCEHIAGFRRTLQYQPFSYMFAFVMQRAGVHEPPFAYDLIMALVWVAVLVVSLMIQFRIREKKVYDLLPEWKKWRETHPKTKLHGLKRIGKELLEWGDALLQAVWTIVLLNIFIFQLYEIPTESMVPEYP